MPATPASITLSPERIALLLTATAAFVVVAGAAAEWLSYRDYAAKGLLPEFQLNRENNVPTWFSTVILLLSALLLTAIVELKQRAGAPYVRHWAVLAVIFGYLSLDEMASLHERADEPLRAWLGSGTLLAWPWIVAAAPLVVLFALSYWRFLLHLPHASRWLFAASGVIYAGSAIGFELLESWSYVRYGSYEHLTFRLFVVAEEALEIFGICLFVYALLDYLRRCYGSLRIDFPVRPHADPATRV